MFAWKYGPEQADTKANIFFYQKSHLNHDSTYDIITGDYMLYFSLNTKCQS